MVGNGFDSRQNFTEATLSTSTYDIAAIRDPESPRTML